MRIQPHTSRSNGNLGRLCFLYNDESESPTRERTRHVDTGVNYLLDLVCAGHVNLVICAGTQNVAEYFHQELVMHCRQGPSKHCLAQSSKKLLCMRLLF